MGALAAAGCTWSARGEPGYAGKWAGLARRGRWTPCSWAQRAERIQWGLSQRLVRADCGLSYTTVQATIAQSTIVACIDHLCRSETVAGLFSAVQEFSLILHHLGGVLPLSDVPCPMCFFVRPFIRHRQQMHELTCNHGDAKVTNRRRHSTNFTAYTHSLQNTTEHRKKSLTNQPTSKQTNIFTCPTSAS